MFYLKLRNQKLSKCSKPVFYDGKIYPSVSALARVLGIGVGTMHHRLKRGKDGRNLGAEVIVWSKPIEYKSVTYPSIEALGRHVGIDRDTIQCRMKRGLTLEQACVPGFIKTVMRPLTIEGRQFESQKAACKYYKISCSAFCSRIKARWSVEEALEIKQRDQSCNGSVYMIYNDVNTKKYIGITSLSVERRFKQHKQTALHKPATKLHYAMNELGHNCFKTRVLKKVNNRSELRKYEKIFIEKYDSINNGYNMFYGGGFVGNKAGSSIKYKGTIYMSLKALAEAYGLIPATLWGRLNVYKMSLDEALTSTLHPNRNKMYADKNN